MALLGNRTTNDVERDDSGNPTTYPASGSAKVDERLAAQRRAEARAANATTGTSTAVAERAPIAVGRDGTAEMAPVVHRSRASMMATVSLVLGLAALLTVFTGVLAGPGVGLGLLAALAAIGGIAATSRPHVAGKGDAMLGLLLGLGAIVVGTLTLTGNMPWLTTDSDQVMRIRDWLDAQAPWLFPNS